MFNARVSPIEVAKATGEQHEALLESVVAPCVSAGCVRAVGSVSESSGGEHCQNQNVGQTRFPPSS